MKPNRRFFFLLAILMLVNLSLRLFPISGNHFYFTMDQGRDAVYVRDILNGHLHLNGPVTSIDGIFTGPLWYYLLAPFYAITSGHPISGPLLLITINLITAASLAIFLKRKTSRRHSLLITSIFIFSSSSLETSLYAFNPFLLPAITIGTTLVLSLLHSNNQPFYLISAALVGLSFHSQIAFAFPLLFSWLILSFILLNRKALRLDYLIIGLFTFSIFLIPHFINELQTNFSQLHIGLNAFQNPQSGIAITSEENLQNFLSVTTKHLTLITNTIFPFFNNPNLWISSLIGLSILIVLAISLLPQRVNIIKRNLFSSRFTLYSLIFILSSIAWFSLSTGLNPWHLVGLPPLILISAALALTALPKPFPLFTLSTLLLFQLFGLGQRLSTYTSNTIDQSLLQNELAAINWTYQQADNQGFATYTYLPSVKDFPYQYLYPWYGQKTYGYLPCKFAVDAAGASSYIPHVKEYQEHQKDCSDLLFLIIEPPVNQDIQDQWKAYTTKNTQLLESTQIGNITIEKRLKSRQKTKK